jgi:ATP-dependent RNA helicase RhlE
LSEQLSRAGIASLAIHGNKSQSARTHALAQFKSGALPVLVATDIAARGLDIVELPHVVNFELPNVPEDYIHRIGRTGRAGAEGEAVSLVCVDEHKLLADIEKVLKRSLPREMIPGFEPDPRIKAEPIPNGRNRGSMPSRAPQSRSSAPARSEPARSSYSRGQASSWRGSAHARPSTDRGTLRRPA